VKSTPIRVVASCAGKSAGNNKAVGTIKRSEFTVGQNLTTAFVSDEIQLRITGEFNKALPK